MRLPLAAAALALLFGSPAFAQAPMPRDAAERKALRKAGSEVLFWSQQQRDANFRRMERIFPAVTVAAGKVRPLPRGKPLPIAAAEVARFVPDQNVAGLIVLQDGRVRLERYARGFGPTQRWTSFSVAKSVTSSLFGAALKDGSITSLDDQVTRYVPELKGSAYDGVTLRQVLTMSSGARWNEDYPDPKSDVAQMFARPVPPGEDVTVTYMKTLARAAPPGTKFNYNTGETNLAGVILARAVKMPISRYASLRLWGPYGMEADAAWQVDEQGKEIAGCCMMVRLRDYARLGQLMLEDGAGLLAPGWVADATRIHQPFAQAGRGYGYFWWIEPTGYRASGIFGQSIWIDPKRKLVIATVSAWPRALDPKLSAQRTAFFERIAAAVERP